jgi:hypothetical protein
MDRGVGEENHKEGSEKGREKQEELKVEGQIRT